MQNFRHVKKSKFNCYCISGLEPEPRVGEYYAMVYVVTAAMEEGRQLLDTDALDASVKKNLKMFFRSGWNYVDMIAINTFFIGAVMRIDPIWGETDRSILSAPSFNVCIKTNFPLLKSTFEKKLLVFTPDMFCILNCNCYWDSGKDLCFSQKSSQNQLRLFCHTFSATHIMIRRMIKW